MKIAMLGTEVILGTKFFGRWWHWVYCGICLLLLRPLPITIPLPSISIRRLWKMWLSWSWRRIQTPSWSSTPRCRLGVRFPSGRSATARTSSSVLNFSARVKPSTIMSTLNFQLIFRRLWWLLKSSVIAEKMRFYGIGLRVVISTFGTWNWRWRNSGRGWKMP